MQTQAIAAIWVLFPGQVWTYRDVTSWSPISRIRSYKSHWNNKCNRRRWHNSGAWQASAMRGMHPATSATSNLYDENATPTNDDGLRAIYGAKLEPPALFQPTRGQSSSEGKIFMYSQRNMTLRSCGHNGNSKKWAECGVSCSNKQHAKQ